MALLGLMLIGMVLETLGVGLVIPAIALLTQPDYATRFPALQPPLALLGNPSHEVLVIGAMLGLAVAYLCKALFLAFLVWRQTRFAYGVQADLSLRLFTVYLRQPYTFHLQRNSAQLLRNATSEVQLFTGGAIVPGMLLLTETMVLLGLCVLLLVVEPLGTLIVVGVLGAAVWGFHRFTRRQIARWGEARQYHEGYRIQHLQQGLGGVKEVKLLGREAEFLRQYSGHNKQSVRAAQLQFTLQQMPRLWLEVLAVGGLAALVFTIVSQGRALDAVLPTLGLFAAAAFRLMPSVNRLINAIQSVRYSLPVINVLHEELQLGGVSTDVGSSSAAAPFGELLELYQVSYSYPGATSPSLSELSLVVRRGESVGLIGPSGAGKSTLVDILLGLLAPDAGEMRVDGKNVQHALRGWQNQIGYVPQSIYLIDDSLRRNVAFGLPDDQIDDDAVWRAIRAAQLEEFVKALPQGLNTQVGERGVRLSGGQRQRIGIARALYHDPSVLVLDEATSSLDTATERGVMDAVRALHGAKTVIIVAHRMSTVADCDRLYRLERGRVVETGEPEHVITRAT